MTGRLDAVLFDVDNTLCEYRRTGADILDVAFERVGVDHFFTAAEYNDRYGEFTDESDSVADLRERCFSTFARERGYDPDVGRAVARVFADERDHTNVRFVDAARETLDALHGEVPLAAVTNGAPEMQTAKLAGLGVTDYFETVVYAGYDTPAKPSPEPFHAALDHLGVVPERALHVGDSLGSDVAGARAAGVGAAWFPGDQDPTAPDPEPDYVLESIADLTDLW
ncbi:MULTISPECIES: HAD family hydrolase [Salinibaculum]|uniref:HAD family hydrolase n=1 Tax=Salinibaculum TaxID=2732368 RepID=UPI0030CC7E4F